MPTHPKSTNAFLSDVILDANAGRNFVPFIGSGLSSPSGIVMGLEFTNYLAFATYLVLCDPWERKRTHGEGQVSHWDLKRQGWPPLPSEREFEAAKNWVDESFQRVSARLNLEINYGSGSPRGVKSLRPKRTDTSLDGLLSALAQPPIPLVLRSSDADREDERIKRFTNYLSSFTARDSRKTLQDLPARINVPGLSNHDMIVELGIRALCDWRETLSFLAMVRIKDSHRSQLDFGEIDFSIIDAFNHTITRDKRPNLGHKILAHLSGPLRVSTLLTTNFDTLTEDAYQALSLPLAVLPVSAKGTLPDARTVATRDTLVKLHGESHDTRADLSLDEEPDAADKATFTEYMTRGTGNVYKARKDAPTSAAHLSSRLLVLGYSGSDNRCVQMIKHWLENATDDPRVYWVCYSDADVKRVNDLFSSTRYNDAIVTTLTARPDLLLHELYQRLVLAMPPGGLVYEFAHMLPPTRKKAFDNNEEKIGEVVRAIKESKHGYLLANCDPRLIRDAVADRVRDAIIRAANGEYASFSDEVCSPLLEIQLWLPAYRHSREAPKSDLVQEELAAQRAFQPVVIDSCGGVVRGAALAIEELSRRSFKKVFWFELQDYLDADALLRDILRSLALRCGQFQSRHVTMHPFPEGLPKKQDDETEGVIKRLCAHLQTILEEYRLDATSIIVLFYGRDSYGCSAGLITSTWGETNPAFFGLHLLLDALGRVGIPTIYFPCSQKRSERKKWNVAEGVQPAPLEKPNADADKHASADLSAYTWTPDPIWARLETASEEASAFADAFSVFSEVLSDACQNLVKFEANGNGTYACVPRDDYEPHEIQKLEFLYAVTLFRHSRHANSICSEGVFPCPFRFQAQAIDNDFVRATEADNWIEALESARVFFTKPGGAVWMHRDIRMILQRTLERIPIPARDDSVRQHEWFTEIRARLHFWIGDWYYKAFCASGHHAPVIESAFHLISSALHAHTAKPKRRANQSLKPEDLQFHRQMIFQSAVMQASKVLLHSWPWLEIWQASAAEVAWLSERHIGQINGRLKEIVNEISVDDQAMRDTLEGCIAEFGDIAIAIGKSMLLEGGGAEKKASGGMSQNTVALRLAPQIKKSSQVPRLAHSIYEIRASKSEFLKQIEKAFKECGGKDDDATAVGLWQAIRDLTTSNDENERQQAKSTFGKLKASWKAQATPTTLHDMIWVLGEAAYVLLRRAKLEYHAEGKIAHDRWLTSTVCCNLAIDFCKHVPPWLLDFEVDAKIKLHSIYSVGLANNGRFYEANRHLNEAQALASKASLATSKRMAIVALRRAEVKLTECHWLSWFIGGQLNLEQAAEGFVSVAASPGNSQDKSPEESHFILPQISFDGRASWRSSELTKRIESVCQQQRASFPPNTPARVLPPRIFECIRISAPATFRSAAVWKKFEGEEKIAIAKEWANASVSALKRLYAGILDEAVRSLEIAEKCLGGVSHSTLWWCRLHTLNLRLFGLLKHIPEHAESSLVFRKQAAGAGIFINFASAVRIAGDDDFRRLRALRYFLEANQWYVHFMGGKPDADPRPDAVYRSYLPDSLQMADMIAGELMKRNLPRNAKAAANAKVGGAASKTKADDPDLLYRAIKRLVDEFSVLHSGEHFREASKDSDVAKAFGLSAKRGRASDA